MRRIKGKLTAADRSGALFLLAHNPKVAGSNPAPANPFNKSSIASNTCSAGIVRTRFEPATSTHPVTADSQVQSASQPARRRRATHREHARRTVHSRVSRSCESRARLRTFHVGHRAPQKLCAGHAWMPSGSSRRRDASAPSCGRHPVDAREHARHVALVAESGSVRCLCK